MKRGRAGEWFENEEVAGFLKADGYEEDFFT